MAAILKVRQRDPLAVRRVAARPGPNAAASAVTMGLLLRGKSSSAADVLTTEHDALWPRTTSHWTLSDLTTTPE